MSPQEPSSSTLEYGFPRVSGDEPGGLISVTAQSVFSPRERG